MLSAFEQEDDDKEHDTHQQNLENRMDLGRWLSPGRQILLRQSGWDCCVVVHDVVQS
jgi:hypothetical protein